MSHFLYHATYVAYLPSILQNGLGAATHRNWTDSTGDVCLTSEPDNAISYAEIAIEEELVPEEIFNSGIALLEINVSGFNLYPDENVLHDDGEDSSIHFVVKEIVSPNRLRLVKVIVNNFEWDANSFK